MTVDIDWNAYRGMPPRQAYDALGTLVPELQRQVAIRRAELVYGLVAAHGIAATADLLEISEQRVGQLRARHQRALDAAAATAIAQSGEAR